MRHSKTRKTGYLSKPMAKLFLSGLSPEERLEGLSVEDRLRGLSLEDRLRGISLEEICAAIDERHDNRTRPEAQLP